MKSGLPLASLLMCAGCSDVCRNSVASRSPSPDGKHLAVLVLRDCGATTGFSTQISILGASDKPSGAGNAFIADDNRGAARVGDWGGVWAETKWLSADRLVVRYAPKSRVFKHEARISGVDIDYQIIGR